MPATRIYDNGRHEQIGMWDAKMLVAMNTQFIAAMLLAGHVLTAASTSFGTKAPIAGYQRPDM